MQYELFKQSDNERILTPKAFLVSETDAKGIITFANDDFCSIAGYNRNELVGKPHSIVRHPDMPKVAFKGLWDTIEQGKVWTGFVKNRAKNNDFYWVYATAYPIMRNGQRYYVSCRKMPSQDEIQKYSQLYKTLH